MTTNEKPDKKWKQQLSKQTVHAFHHDHPCISLGLSFLHRLKCRQRSGRRSSLSTMRASSGGAGSLARATERPSGPSGTVSTMPPHHIHSTDSRLNCKQAQERLPETETVVFILFFFSFSSSLSQKQIWLLCSFVLTWILLSGGCWQKCRKHLMPFITYKVLRSGGFHQWGQLSPPYLLTFVVS